MVSNNYKKIYPDGISFVFWNDFVVPQVRRIKGYKCEECGSSKNLDVHHTRKDLVNINTLNLLCRKCHKTKHKRKKK